jgi:hypothetical protein
MLQGITRRVAAWATGLLLLPGLFLLAVGCRPAPVTSPSGPEIRIDDVALFYRSYDATGGHPTAAQLDRSYLGAGSEGLRRFAALRRVSGTAIVAVLEARPQIYADARRCLDVLPAVKRRLTAALVRLVELYPEARIAAPVTVVVGRGKPVGMTDAAGVAIGLEALCAADFADPDLEDRFVHTIAHEYGHIQQPRADETDVPGATVLFASLIEGGAEFIAELISGGVSSRHLAALTRGRETMIEAGFVEDKYRTDLSGWLYNGRGTPEHPGDLGYWVGYRIVKAYYQHTPDKHQALRDLIEMKDPEAFLARSGWRPGAALGGEERE